ncbi:hypothetical protein O8B39_17515 [Agrobacterium rhizogenes]|nr:hypothetical protein [Rhizobium rhizogenes]
MTEDTVNRKGTPGPWGIEKTKNDWWVGQLGPDGKVDLIVARFPTGREYSETYIDRNKSDALLVAAAPELLLALNELLEAYSKPDERLCCDGRDCGCMGSTVHQQAEHYARAAIAKAEGRS